MRRLRILFVLVVAIFAALALSIALENTASSATAQNQSQPRSSALSSEKAAPVASVTTPVASNGIAPTIVASNFGIRTLAAAPLSAEALSKLTSASSAGPTNQQLFLTSTDKPNKIFSLVAPSAGSNSPAAAVSAAKQMITVAGIGAVGSVGDGGAAISAQLDLNDAEISARSGIAVASDGTVYIADTGNATIRAVAGPASSEPGIIRSLAGRWAPRQNVELSQPMGIALDSAGNLYIADSGANAIDVLYGAASPKAGQLETLAHMVAPGTVAVTLDGRTVFASSPQTGTILAINTQTRALRTPAINPAGFFAAAQQRSGSSRITPTGLAVDGGGNLFIAYSNPGAAYDEILRLDAFSSKVTLAARGLSSPGDISFDAKGNLFVANQGMRNVVRFNLLGVAALGVTLTPPVSDCTDESNTIFCEQLIGGTSSSQSYELTNNTATELSGLATTFVSGNSGDFAVMSSSCAATLAASASCAFNVVFKPTANASAFQSNDGATCSASGTANSRCSTLNINYVGAVTPLSAVVSGIADDFEIVCVTSTTSSCVALPDSNFDQITVSQGDAAIFQLQIVPDNTFSGPVNLVCPSRLPVSPVGAIGNPTTCGLTLGTTVSEPLQSALTVDVVAGTPLPFTMTIQTTTTLGTTTPPVTTTPPAMVKRSASLVGLLAGRANGRGGKGSGPAMPAASKPATVAPGFSISRTAVATNCVLIFVSILLLGFAFRRKAVSLKQSAFAIFAFAFVIFAVAGCGGGQKTATVIPFTPSGTYTLTVQGSAQNGARGYTCTLVVN